MASNFVLLFQNFDVQNLDAEGRWADDNTLVPLAIPVIGAIPYLCTGQARASTQGSYGWPIVPLLDRSPAATAPGRESKSRTNTVRRWSGLRPGGYSSWRSKTSFEPITMTTMDTTQPARVNIDAGWPLAVAIAQWPIEVGVSSLTIGTSPPMS